MNDREAIEKIIEAARITGLTAFVGEFQLAGWSETHSDGAKATFWLASTDDLEPFRAMTVRKKKQAGQRLITVMFEIGEYEQPVVHSNSDSLIHIDTIYHPAGTRGDLSGNEIETRFVSLGLDTKPFGKYATELHRLGWFFAPKVLEAIGTDEDYRAWIQKQKCVVCGGQDWVAEIGEGRCEATHVKRPSNSGLGHKPDYSCVALCHRDHIEGQHPDGLFAIYEIWCDLTVRDKPSLSDIPAAREWLDKQRDKLLKEWASKTLAAKLGYSSMGMCPPDELVAWANKHDLSDTLPAIYR